MRFFRMREDRRRHYDDGFRREALEPIKAGAGKDTLARRRQIRLEGHAPEEFRSMSLVV